jgi:hypoxanthine-guanine phosphoribosyltransferase
MTNQPSPAWEDEIRAAERKRIADLVADMTDHEVVFVEDVIALIEESS